MGDPAAARVLRRWRKIAAFPPAPPNGEGDGLTSAGKRNIPKNHEFQPRALKPLSKALWASTVALGHTLTAYRHLSRLKSTTVSPDGLMGGRGYVMRLADMRQKLYEASEALSAISDTMFDEITAPHWKPKLAQLDESDRDDVTRFVEEAQEVMENPEGEAEEEIDEIESKAKRKRQSMESEGDKSSGLPLADAAQDESSVHSDDAIPPAMHAKQASSSPWLLELYGNVDGGTCAEALYANCSRRANSSQPVSELPGGPRVDHLGPATGTGPYGEFNPPESAPADEWSADGGGAARRDDSGEDYDYPSEWENQATTAAWKVSESTLPEGGKNDEYTDAWDFGNARWKAPEALVAKSTVPDSSADDTPTHAWDFGIGYGARGEGAGDHANPSDEGNGTKGVWGPHSGLPGALGTSSGDIPQALDVALNRRAMDALYGRLPQDAAGNVARADYYGGAKDNMVSIGTSQTPTSEEGRGESGQRLLNTYYTLDDVNTPYQRYDFSTHTLREPDGLFEGQDYQEPFAPGGEATR